MPLILKCLKYGYQHIRKSGCRISVYQGIRKNKPDVLIT